MFDRPKQFRFTGDRFQDRITLSSGETKGARFKAWLTEKMAEPRFCSRHPKTGLVLNCGELEIREAYKNDDCDSRRWGEQGEIEPGAFHFNAPLSCPACWCTYALCPPEFHQTSFDTLDASTDEAAKAVARSREFAAQVNRQGCGFALFVGGPGVGKTRLACNVIHALENSDSLYVRQGELTCALRATYGRKNVVLRNNRRGNDDDESDEEPPSPLEIVQKVRFLVLDEIGCAPLATDEMLLLDETLRHRYDQRKPTILISNLPLNAFQEYLGDAPYDRIHHASGGGKFIFQFKGKSYRRTSGETYLDGLD